MHHPRPPEKHNSARSQGFADYRSVVATPMDLGTIAARVASGAYADQDFGAEKLLTHVRQVSKSQQRGSC